MEDQENIGKRSGKGQGEGQGKARGRSGEGHGEVGEGRGRSGEGGERRVQFCRKKKQMKLRAMRLDEKRSRSKPQKRSAPPDRSDTRKTSKFLKKKQKNENHYVLTTQTIFFSLLSFFGGILDFQIFQFFAVIFYFQQISKAFGRFHPNH